MTFIREEKICKKIRSIKKKHSQQSRCNRYLIHFFCWMMILRVGIR